MNIMDSNSLTDNVYSLPNTEKMPVLFIGHGSPMNAIENNSFSQAWENIGKELPKPKAILCISAHWFVNGSYVTAIEKPRTIHDFYGFPKELNDFQYNAVGSTELAKEIINLDTGKEFNFLPDNKWGLDHGTWSVLCRMYPLADIPVVQLSIDMRKPPQFHYETGKIIKSLRNNGVLIIGSGNIVHNLRMISNNINGFDWAIEFDSKIKNLVDNRDYKSIIEYAGLGSAARLSVPTPEHFLPLLYILGASESDESLQYYTEEITMGSLGMRSIKFG
jgi:4,5-DOPA dioxygenase extradiol